MKGPPNVYLLGMCVSRHSDLYFVVVVVVVYFFFLS